MTLSNLIANKMPSSHGTLRFTARDFVASSSGLIADDLKAAIAARGKASLIVSGGRSPAQVYQALSQIELPWEKVSIGLVDERWVEAGQSGSNADFVARNLLQNKAARARFIGLKTGAVTPADGLAAAERALAAIEQPFDICVMGMGLDGHTASWFPDSAGLEAALDMRSQKTVCAIDATGCPVAGDHPARMSLTLPAVLKSRRIILMIAGRDKEAVFDSALGYSMEERPVTGLIAAGPRLTVLTDEND